MQVVAGTLVAVLALMPMSVPVGAQDGEWSTPRTPWGHPDLQGTWSNTTTTPMERPEDLAGREFLTEEERVARNPGSGISAETRTEFMPTGAVNDYWLEKGDLLLRTSLLVDPPDGRYPPLTPQALERLARRRASYTGGELASWEDFSTYDRCLTRGMPGAMTPGWYNHNYLILQTPTHVAILVEMIHDARIVRLDGQPADGVEQWLGQSTGRWEGDTLVIETTHLEEPRTPRGGAPDAHRRRRHRLPGDRQRRGRVACPLDGADADVGHRRPAVRVRLPRGELRPAEHALRQARRGGALTAAGCCPARRRISPGVGRLRGRSR